MRFLKGLLALALVFSVLALAFGVGGWIWFNDQINRPGPSGVLSEFRIEAGEGLASVASRLETAGVITDDRLLRLKARIDGSETAIKAGAYSISARASIVDVLAQLVAGDVIQLRLTIPEGLTTAQILQRVEAADVLSGPMPEQAVEEGELLPDTYLFGAGTTRAQFIERMKRARDDLLDDLWPERQNGLPLKTREDAIKLASIVEKETGVDGERGKIAGLFVSRLKKGMRLESDPTIIYGISRGEPLYNSRGERRTLYRSEIDRRTDWNTYQIDGLPKTPIANPGREAIAAVLNPPETEYLFFVADGQGGHLFAETYDEHLRNVAQYRAYERAEIARERA
ncbi:MAG: endolytic transglycosylase MltG, partial [Pseudomonadota bacterium]